MKILIKNYVTEGYRLGGSFVIKYQPSHIDEKIIDITGIAGYTWLTKLQLKDLIDDLQEIHDSLP